jgi:glycosyltransferase 2 family protein
LLRSRRVWLGFALSLIFLGIFLYQTDFGEIRDAFAEANYAIAFASLPVYFLGIWVRTIRWQYLLRPVARIRTARLFPVVIIGLTANNLLPARIGELVRAYLLGEREKVSKAAALGTIAVDRLFDGLTLIPMLVITAAFVGVDEEFELPRIGWNIDLVQLAVIMAALFGAALLVLFVLAFSPAWRDRADRLLMALTPKRFEPAVTGLMHSFVDGLASLRSPADLGVAWVMSGISWLLEATMYYMVGLAFDLDVGFQYYLLVTAAANLAISVLASQGGIGPFEVVAKQVMIAAGVGASLATAYAIGLHALVLLPVIAVGLYFLWTMDLSVGEMFRRSTRSEKDTTARSSVAPEEVIT